MKIQSKALEGIARMMGENETGSSLISILKESGVKDSLIVYPNTKWKMVFDVMLELAKSENEVDYQTLLNIFKKFTHPLNWRGDDQRSLDVIESMNRWLKYDGIELQLNRGRIEVGQYMDRVEHDSKFEEAIDVDIENTYKFIKVHCSDDLILWKKSYQLLISVVDTYFEEMENVDERLNEFYLRLIKIVNNCSNKIVDSTNGVRTTGVPVPGENIYIPFRTLYGAEASLSNSIASDPKKDIKIKMNEYLGKLTELIFDCDLSDVLSEADWQKQLNDISLYLSELKQKKAGKGLTGQGDGVVALPVDWKWSDDGKVYLLGGKGKLPFVGNDDAIRITAFKMLIDGNGDFVTVKKISEKTNKVENYIRVVMGQLNEKFVNNKVQKYLGIEEKGKSNEAGAYRIVVKG
jgi:hypothetical protein